ncbi:MAG: enoyl-CoA hydratase/isomerase family protein [Rhodospirillales bacterium]|nr:enoyl-CoA hydratase/isomerase family protein [Rhodospirillales bacterium]
MSDQGGVVQTGVEAGVGLIELSRPEKYNCLSGEVARAIDEAVAAYAADDAVRAILVSSQGKHFCTGADLHEVLELRQDEDKFRDFIDYGQSVFSRLESAPLPVVVAVQGLCLAGGIELMLSCDVAFAAESARFGDQHAEYGLLPGWGGSQRLPRILGLRRALDLFYSHRWIAADEALNWGLVNYVVPDDAMRDEAMNYCRKLTEKSSRGLAAMKRLARQGIEVSLADGIRLEREAAVEHTIGDDAGEGLAAFQERRRPNFA